MTIFRQKATKRNGKRVSEHSVGHVGERESDAWRGAHCHAKEGPKMPMPMPMLTQTNVNCFRPFQPLVSAPASDVAQTKPKRLKPIKSLNLNIIF